MWLTTSFDYLVTRKEGPTSGAGSLTLLKHMQTSLFLWGSHYSSFSLLWSVTVLCKCIKFVFRFSLFVIDLSVFLLKDFCLSLWYISSNSLYKRLKYVTTIHYTFFVGSLKHQMNNFNVKSYIFHGHAQIAIKNATPTSN